jgi:vacuolar-type H+-ATPase subunit H
MNEHSTPPDEGGQQSSAGSMANPERLRQASPAPAGQGLAAQAGERVQAIIEAAERTAAAIIEDAEAQARKYIEEARAHADRAATQRAEEMSVLTDHLIDRTESVKQQSDELLRMLDETKRRLGEAEPAGQAPRQLAPSQHLKAVEKQPGAERPGDGPSVGARLLTTQMAVAGSSRAEIASRLQNEFGIEDTGPMLDAILGQEE